MIEQIFNMLMLLIEHKKMKAADIAEKLGVSVKSVMRYLDTLSLRGIPVVCEKGRNGGIKLGEEFVMSRNFFTQNELNLIQNALIVQQNQLENAPIILKLNSLNQAFSPVDNAKVIHIQSHDRSHLINDKIAVITRCMNTEKTLDIRYYSRDGKYSKRRIVPLTFLVKADEWYIYCFCLLRNEYRTFKLTRISHMFISDAHGLNFSTYPKLWNLQGDDEIDLKIKVLPKGRFMVIDWLGVESLNTTQDTDEIVMVKADYSLDLIYKLLSFGDGIEILSPQKIVDEYNIIVKSISDKYN